MTIKSAGSRTDLLGPKSDPKTSPTSTPVAIIGVSCRFAGSTTSPEKLWQVCATGRDCWSSIPVERFNLESYYDPEKGKRGRMNVQGGFFLDEDIALFDAAFFGFSEEMARSMDPQLRLLLEVVYEATENAGLPIEKLAGSKTSVFSGLFSKDYYDSLMRDPEQLTPSFIPGTGTAMYANRISHFFDLQGPSVALDTGCSSGLVSLNQGVRSIQHGDSDISIVTGANALINPDLFLTLCRTGALGGDGKCYAWDERAQGYGRAEGIASLILKPLDVALRDGDFIHAVIQGTALNQDGNTPTVTTPSMTAQINVINECYRQAGLNLSETAYVEGHMTGTGAGDPIEAEALARTFGKARKANDPVIVGSVKTNIGHTEAVSGIAAVIKTVYALKNQMIPPNLNHETPSPKIPLDEWHLQVPASLMPWPKNKPLRASINNFGYGGTNAHVILEAPPVKSTKALNGVNDGIHHHIRSQVFVISAKDSSSLGEMTKNLAAYSRQKITGVHADEGQSLKNLAYTLSERRSRFSWIRALRAGSYEALAEGLETPIGKPSHPTKRPRLAFVFNGQGAQWFGMGRELISQYPVFRSSLQRATKLFKGFGASWSLEEELLRDEASTRVHDVKMGQPMCIALQLALVDLLSSWGIAPTAVTSHSSGEIAAAYAVGALSFEEVIGAAYFRSSFASSGPGSAPTGGMLAASLGQEAAEMYVTNVREGRAVVACVNSPGSVTISGDMAAIDEISSKLQQDGIWSRKLKVPTAYHSHHMVPLAKSYLEVLRQVMTVGRTWNGAIFASPVSGGLLTSPKQLGPEHWVENMIKPVLFSQAFESMCFATADSEQNKTNIDFVVELGPHSALGGPIQQILKSRSTKLPYASCLIRGMNAVETMQNLVCELLQNGYPVELPTVNSPSGSTEDTFVNDLPSYPWNHSTRYWMEPAISKAIREKPFRPHQLLGSLLPSASALTRIWRNFLLASEISWLREHQVDGQLVLPGASFVSMAIEAVRKITDPSELTIQGYRLRDIDISNALTIPDSSYGTEIQLSLRACDVRELDHSGWHEFKVCSVTGNGETVVEHCTGFVGVERTSNSPTAFNHYEGRGPTESSFFVPGAQVRNANVEAIFGNLRNMSIVHGTAFQNLSSCCLATNRAITNFTISEAALDNDFYVLHPTTLDSIFLSCYANVSQSLQNSSMIVPRAISKMYVPRSLRRSGNSDLVSFTELLKETRRGTLSDVYVADGSNQEATSSYLHITGLYLQAIPMVGTAIVNNGELSKTRWEVDISHRVPASIRDSWKIYLDPSAKRWENSLEQVSYYFINKAVKQLGGLNSDTWDPQHKRFYNWMKSIIDAGKSGALGPNCQLVLEKDNGDMQTLVDELATANVAGQTTRRVGEQLASIVCGELKIEGSLLNNYYRELPRFQRQYKQVASLVERYSLKHPGAKVLELAGGSDSIAPTVLSSFASGAGLSGGKTLLGHYTLISASPAAFDQAKERLSVWSDMITFETLDVGRDPMEQGFAEGSYDLVVACFALHSNTNLKAALVNVRKLLKPGGSLLIAETTRDTLDMQMVFGALPGWWLSEDPDRKQSPNAPLTTWDRVLRSCGFSGLDFDIGDCEDVTYRCGSVILTTALSETRYYQDVSVIYYQDPPPQSWVKLLGEKIYNLTGKYPTIESLAQADPKDKVCIFAVDMEVPILDRMDAGQFENLRHLLLSSQAVLWLSSGSLIEAKHPLYAQTQGLLRTIRREDTSKRYIHLDFEQSQGAWATEQVEYIMHVFQQSFNMEDRSSTIEMEYAVKDEMLHVPRLIPLTPKENPISIAQSDAVSVSQPFRQTDRSLVWETSNKQLLSDIYFVENLTVLGDLPSGMIEIEPKAFGLKFRDVMEALGQLDERYITHECSGVVTKMGSNTKESGLRVGDRVCGDFRGRFSSRIRTKWANAVKIPDELPWEEAAGFPSVNSTAFHSLIEVAQLQPGEKVLIHAATGGVGQAAIIIAQHLGAEVFATCSTAVKRQLLVDRYGVDPDHIFSSRDTSFKEAILAKTGGEGVDVVLNSLAGPLLKATWECIARFGRFVEIGRADFESGKLLDMKTFGRATTFAAVDLQLMVNFNVNRYRSLLTRCLRLWQENRLPHVGPITVFPMTDMEKAMRQMAEGTHIGKLVLVPGPNDHVRVINKYRPVSLDASDGTYLLVGGLGGIGRAIADWMVGRGAKNILLVSRNAKSHPEADSLRQRAMANGCNLEIENCDVSDETSFLMMLASIRMPPIRGVIMAAMVLDDTILERMTFDQWVHATRSKVTGTLNLHKHLPNLSFFIMLSSVTGIGGSVSQANYAAGNTFQDALARHRTLQGLPAVVIDLGAVSSVGFVAQVSAAERERINKIYGVVELEEALYLIEDGIRNPLRKEADNSQVITYISTGHGSPIPLPVQADMRFSAYLTASLHRGEQGMEGDATAAANASVMLLRALKGGQAAPKLVTEALVAKLSEILPSVDLEDVDPKRSLVFYGVDSLVAVELRNWLRGMANAQLSIFEITQSQSIIKLGALVAQKLKEKTVGNVAASHVNGN